MKKIIASPNAPKAVGPYSQAVENNGTIYVSGQLPIDASTGQMAEGIEEQTRQSLTNIRYILEEAGYALADVVTVTSPEAIFLFGGPAKAGNLILDPIKWYMEEDMLITFKNKVKVLPSELQNKNAAVLGASALVWQATK